MSTRDKKCTRKAGNGKMRGRFFGNPSLEKRVQGEILQVNCKRWRDWRKQRDFESDKDKDFRKKQIHNEKVGNLNSDNFWSEVSIGRH